jgi:small ligand-binding sensory domain FIST
MSGDGTMRWASAGSRATDSAAAATEACEAVSRALEGPHGVDLALLFLSAHHAAHAESIAAIVRRRLSPGTLMGATARGIIDADHEVEAEPAIALIAARLPGVTLQAFVLVGEAWADAYENPGVFAQLAPQARGAELVLMLADPFSLDVESVLASFDRHAPGVRVVGGLASAASRPGGNALLLNDWIGDQGGVGLALSGSLRADVIVSQGCRAVGPPLEVTAGEQNLVMELDGRPALERVEEVLRSLDEADRERIQNGLYIGRPVTPEAAGRGDYVIRNLLGADRERGVLAIGDRAVPHERLRLHVRDASTAREDLDMLLSPQAFDRAPGAALLFACNGRGLGLYGEPDGDIAALQGALGGAVPVAGMFCAGELGPVGSRNLLHGHTASIAILRPR